MRDESRRLERHHQRVQELLPWYVNQTLGPDEARCVEEHLAGCARCREELAGARELARAVHGVAEVAPSPHPVQLARLMARIDAAEAAFPTGRARGRLGEAVRRWRLEGLSPRQLLELLGSKAPSVRGLAVAELVVIVMLVAALAWWRTAPILPAAAPAAPAAPAEYRTLSDPGGPPAAAGALQVRVVFAPDASERQIRDLLLAAGAQIAGGPSRLGAYVLEIPPAGPAGSAHHALDSLDVVLAHLRVQPIVTFAEPMPPTPPMPPISPISPIPDAPAGQDRREAR